MLNLRAFFSGGNRGPTAPIVFTDASRGALELARGAATQRGHGYVASEHILLGLLALDHPGFDALTRRLGLDRAAVAATVDSLIQRGTGAIPAGPDLPYTSRAKKVLELAMVSARSMGTTEVGPEQLLAGLCAEGRGVGARALSEFGVGVGEIRNAMSDATS